MSTSGEQSSTAQEHQLDWQTKLEQLQSQHKEESFQQRQEHLEQLKLLQAQILTELTTTSVNNSSISAGPLDSSFPVSPTSSKSTQPSSLPPSTRDQTVALTRTHSSSDPQLFVGGVGPTHRPPSPSPDRATSVGCTPISSPRAQSLTQSPRNVDEKGHAQAKAERPGLTIGPSFEFVASNAGLAKTSTVESLDQTSHDAASTSVEVSPIKADEDRKSFSPKQSLKDFQRNFPDGVEGETTNNSLSPPRRKLAWTETPSQRSNLPHPPSPLPPPRELTIKTPLTSQSLVVPTPQYPAIQFSPATYRYGSPSTSGIQVRTSPGSVSMTTPSLRSSGGGGVRSSILSDSQSRATLMEKHHKHMEDLKMYYESELTELRDRIQRLESDKNEPSPSVMNPRRSVSPLCTSFVSNQQRSPQHPTTPRHNPTRQLFFPSSLVKGRAVTPASVYSTGGDGTGSKGTGGGDVSPAPVVNESELWMVQNENSRLKGECSDLRNQLDQADRERRSLEEQAKRLQEHTLDWKERLEASERMVSVLHERLESTRSQLYDQDKLVGQLRSDLQVAAEELQYWKEQRSQDMEKIEQLFDEFEVLQQENESVRSANSQLQYEVDETHKKMMSYKVTVDKYQALEAQYKRTIHELEDEIRHLQHVNNRLHSMGTHYQLGSYGSPFNQPDEAKVQASPRSTSRDVIPPPSTPAPQISDSPERRETPSNSVAKGPLTRRKWLESSIPGLIYGRGEEEGGSREETVKQRSATDEPPPAITNSPSRLPAMVNMSSGLKESKRHSPTKRQPSTSPGRPVTSNQSLPLEQPPVSTKAIQKVVLKEDGSGEDPVNYAYNQKWYEGGSSQSSLAELALKAIRHGDVIGSSESGHSNLSKKKSRSSKEKEMSIEERVKQHMRIVSEAERKLASLQKEKERLESGLLKTPRTGSRATRQAKQTKLEAEKRLEEVVKEIGSVRMLLRKHHALK